MKYKIGDKVKVRNDLVANKKYGSQTFVPTMAKFTGEQIIKEVYTQGYTIKADKNLCQYLWTDEMFEDTEENKMENQNITINMENLSQEERSTLLSLIEKANKPKNKVWKPEENETYYYSYSDGSVNHDIFHHCNVTGDYVHENRYAMGNCFKTREEAEFTLEKQKVIMELKRFALEHNDKEIDWNNIEQRKCFLSYQHDKNIIFIDFYYSVQIYNIYFTSEEIAQAAIKEIGEERLKKYYFEVEE